MTLIHAAFLRLDLYYWREWGIMPVVTATGVFLCLYVDDKGHHPCDRRLVFSRHLPNAVIVILCLLHRNITIILLLLQVLVIVLLEQSQKYQKKTYQGMKMISLICLFL